MMAGKMVGNISTKTLHARRSHIVLEMRALLPSKEWWTLEELGDRLGVSSAYISSLTAWMREEGVLEERTPGTRPILLKLKKDLQRPLESADSTITYFGPIPANDKRAAESWMEADDVSPSTFFHRALEAYIEKRDRILRKGWNG